MSLREQLTNWLLTREVEGCTIEQTPDGVALVSSEVIGNVNFYDLNGQMVVELRASKTSDDESIFFLHFELTDLNRAKHFYLQMEDSIIEFLNRKITHVLLCCTCGMTTTFFALKLNETAATLGLDYDFEAKALPKAKEEGDAYDAVLLAPQVGFERDAVAEALPNTVVIEMPAQIFGAYDAAAALRLVVDALANSSREDSDTISVENSLGEKSRILSISYVMREERVCTLSYRVYDHGRTTLSGQIVKRHLSHKSVFELHDALQAAGWDSSDFDAVGIALPMRVHEGIVYSDDSSAPALSEDLQKKLSDAWGTNVFVHPAGVAAAASCYVQQSKYENVGFHAQVLGNPSCVEGFIMGGQPHYGRGGMVGRLGITAPGMNLSMDLLDAAWRYDGLHELVAHYLAAVACTVGPDVVYVWCDFMPDTQDLRLELAKLLPEDAMPELVAVEATGYEDMVLLGEMALCLYELGKQ